MKKPADQIEHQFLYQGVRVTVYPKVVRYGDRLYQRHLLPNGLRMALAARSISQ